MDGFIKIGHRGAMGYEPENTLASFQKAIELDADMVELDVYLCGTGELVVIHDDTVNRTTNGKGSVFQMTLAELKKLDAGRGETIPMFEEVVDLVDRRVAINVELKGISTAKPVAGLIQQYKAKGWDENLFLVSSFDGEELREFRRYSPNTKIGILFKKRPNDLFDFVEEVAAYSIHIPLKKFSADLMNEARQRGLKVFVWTADSPADIRRLVDVGVDGIFSNFPDRLK